MSDFKGTKGKWFLSENQSTIVSENNCLIARVFDGNGYALLEHKEQSEEIVYANAKVMACAKEMRSALKEVLSYLDSDIKNDAEEMLYFKINELIKKSTI